MVIGRNKVNVFSCTRSRSPFVFILYGHLRIVHEGIQDIKMISFMTTPKVFLQIAIILTVFKTSSQEDGRGLHKNLDLKSLTIISPPPCGPEIEFLYIIHTAPNHSDLRHTLRNSWASTEIKNDQFQKSKRVFLIGRSNETIEDSNKKEHEMYRDIFMYDKTDAYRNMTIKVTILILMFGHY